jgi:glycosyltransferase involved in cell wall biosynthesis
MNASLSTFRSRENLSKSRPRFGLISEGRLLNSIEEALQRTAVIIPARNEEDSLPLVLGDLPGVGVVIIADNGSTDSTAVIARQAGCQVVSEPIAGYGRACLSAMRHLDKLCQDDLTHIEYVCFLDGDYSDHAEQLQQLLLPIVHDESDFVLGSRLLGRRETGAMPPQAVWGNRLACFLMNQIWKTDYTDLGPFRVIRRQSLIDLNMQDLNFGWTVEMQVKAAVANLRIVEVPVNYRRRIGISKISGTVTGTIKAGYKILFTIAKYACKINVRSAS